jgi:hypothetical protein
MKEKRIEMDIGESSYPLVTEHLRSRHPIVLSDISDGSSEPAMNCSSCWALQQILCPMPIILRNDVSVFSA